MTHALHLPILAADGDRVPFHADPILAAIERHEEAYAVFQVAPGGVASEAADAETCEALHALLATPCASRAGMLCLIRHLRWWLAEEAPNANAYETEGGLSAWAVAQAREADLSRCLGVDPIRRDPVDLPSGRLIGSLIDLRPAMTGPDQAQVTAASDRPLVGRALYAAGEMLAALIIVAGGCGFVGFALIL